MNLFHIFTTHKMTLITQLNKEFNHYLTEKISVKEPVNLYEPIKYILDLGGKRIRPLLVLLTANLFGTAYKKAFPAALAVEVFHNFTLIHDDIMDAASMRRGNQTVHQKWNKNIGILSGDAMLILAYSFIEEYPEAMYKQIMCMFNKTAIEVCEGQQFDMDFEQRSEVSMDQYMEMIRLKTAVLLASAFEIGAIIAEASLKDRKSIYQFGIHLGLAFQIQDDYLDTFGNEQTFGKKIGGDILENKKTFLFIAALQNSDQQEQALLNEFFKETHESEKIKRVTQFFIDKKIPELAQKTIENYTNLAFTFVDELSITDIKKQQLKEIGLKLMNRNA